MDIKQYRNFFMAGLQRSNPALKRIQEFKIIRVVQNVAGLKINGLNRLTSCRSQSSKTGALLLAK